MDNQAKPTLGTAYDRLGSSRFCSPHVYNFNGTPVKEQYAFLDNSKKSPPTQQRISLANRNPNERYICLVDDQCTRVFKTILDRNQHMREVHGRVSVVPKFNCPEAVIPEICGRAEDNGFLDQRSMTRHLEKVHGMTSKSEAEFKISSESLSMSNPDHLNPLHP